MGSDGPRKIPERKRPKYTGRGREHSYLALPHYLLDSAEFAALSPVAVKLLLQVAAKFRGKNNGDLAIVWSDFRNRGWNSETTLQRAREELLAAGWLRCTRIPLKRRCGLYAVTWLPVDECEGHFLEVAAERVASNAWRKQNQTPRNWSKDPQKLEENPCGDGANGQLNTSGEGLTDQIAA